MNKIFIIDRYNNPGLLRFIQTKIFFDANNQALDWAYDCDVVDHIDQIQAEPGIVINSNQFITSNFRRQYPRVTTLLDARQDKDLIEFDVDYDYVISHRPPFAKGSKQLYILENLYKVILRSKKLIYLDNTEKLGTVAGGLSHFFGLASGFKSVKLVKEIGINNLKSITVYDMCQRQLNFQKFLHSQSELPVSLDVEPPYCGVYAPDNDIRKFWPEWHAADVKFEILDLFSGPVFPASSLIWISNVFRYEPTIFKLGWQACKSAKQRLFQQNNSCIII